MSKVLAKGRNLIRVRLPTGFSQGAGSVGSVGRISMERGRGPSQLSMVCRIGGLCGGVRYDRFRFPMAWAVNPQRYLLCNPMVGWGHFKDVEGACIRPFCEPPQAACSGGFLSEEHCREMV